jgi:hypothetical protein
MSNNTRPIGYALSYHSVVWWRGTAAEFDAALDELEGLPVRVAAALLRDGYHSRQAICEERDDRLLAVRNFGVGSLAIVRAWCGKERGE